MLAGKRVFNMTDSTAYVGYDTGEEEPQARLSYPGLIAASKNVTFHDFSSPGAQVDFQYQGGAFCGMRCTAHASLAFMRGFGIDIVNFLGGTNDWYHASGVSHYSENIYFIGKAAASLGFPRISICTPFIRYYTGDEPTNGRGETLNDYCNALPAVVTRLQTEFPGADIQFIDTREFIPMDRSLFCEDDAHLKVPAHALIAPALLDVWVNTLHWL